MIFFGVCACVCVCRYLSVGNLRDANNIMDEIKKLAWAKELEFPESELMRFIDYLLQTLVFLLYLFILILFLHVSEKFNIISTCDCRLMRDALPLFNMLRQKFSSSIERDPMFIEVDNPFFFFFKLLANLSIPIIFSKVLFGAQLLEDIREKFYGVRRKNPLQGMFGELFKVHFFSSHCNNI